MDAVSAHCSACGGERRHDVAHVERTSWEDEIEAGSFVRGGNIYELLKCRGCETVCMRRSHWHSEFLNADGSPEVTVTYFPPASLRPPPRWLADLLLALPMSDLSVQYLLKEVYVAVQNDCPRLAVMGVRALIEHVMIEKVGDLGSFPEKLDAFERDGFISKLQRQLIESVLETGHAAIHRSFEPSPDTLFAVLDITENIIESIYITSLRALDLGKVPPRRKA